MILRYNDVVIDEEGTAWFAENRWNSIFCKKKDEDVEHLGFFLDENNTTKDLFRNTVFCNGWIVFCPYDGQNIHMINYKNREKKSIRVENLCNKKYGKACLYGAFSHGDMVYMLQACDTTIIALNIHTLEIKKIDLIERKTAEDYIRFWGHRVVKLGTTVYLCNEDESQIIEFDIENGKVIVNDYKKEINNVSDFYVYDAEIKYIVDKQGKVFCNKAGRIETVLDVSAKECSIIQYQKQLYIYSLGEKKIVGEIFHASKKAGENISVEFEKIISNAVVGNYLFIQTENGTCYKDLSPIALYEIDSHRVRMGADFLIYEDKRLDFKFFVENVVDMFSNK